MKGKEKTGETMNKLQKLIYEQLSSSDPRDAYYIPEKKFNPEDSTQTFYKMFVRHASEQVILKHGHKVFRLSRHEQDLAFFCLSLLQFEAKFPLRVFSIDEKKTEEQGPHEDSVDKDVWVETQFLISSVTSNGEYEQKEKRFESKVLNFFRQELLPRLKDFKKQWISWDHMTSDEYTDEKVVSRFQKEIIQWANNRFKELCAH